MNLFEKESNTMSCIASSPKPDSAGYERFARLFPSSEVELDSMLASAESTPEGDRLSLDDGFSLFERRMSVF